MVAKLPGPSAAGRSSLVKVRWSTGCRVRAGWCEHIASLMITVVRTENPNSTTVSDGNSWSSSGVEAGTDMIHGFVSYVWGESVAESIANSIEHAPNTNSSYDPFAILYNTTGTLIPPAPAPAVPANAPTNYGIVLYPGVSSLETWAALEPLHLPATPFNVTTIAATLDPITFNVDLPILPAHLGGMLPLRGQTIIPAATFATAPEIEVLVVPGSPRVPFDPEVTAFIVEQYPKLRYLISVGTGAALVAQSG